MCARLRIGGSIFQIDRDATHIMRTAPQVWALLGAASTVNPDAQLCVHAIGEHLLRLAQVHEPPRAPLPQRRA